MTTERKIVQAPASLVDNGKINFGVFDAPLHNVNLADAALPGPLGPAPDWWKRFRLKKWQFFLLTHPKYSVCFIVIDLVYTSSSFVFVFDRERRKSFEHKRIKLDRKLAVPDNLYDGRCFFRESGYNVEIHNKLDEGLHTLDVRVGEKRGAPAVNVDANVLQRPGEIQPLVVSLPLGGGRGMYSNKVVCPVEGTARIGDEEITYDPARDTAVIDEHRGLYPRHTFWKWATFGVIGPDGKTLGVQLTDNLIKDQAAWNENCIYTGDTITLLGPARFDFDIRDVMKPWKLSDAEGRVRLDFAPLGVKLDRVNLGFFNMDYRQPFGRFNGALTDDRGTEYKIKDAFGVTEYHNAYY